MITINIVDPATRQKCAYPSIIHAGRLCVAIPAGNRFAVSSHLEANGDITSSRVEWVVSVDGRDTLTNKPASRSLEGMISGRRYTCEGFRVSSSEVREFVCVNLGDGATTAERNGTTSSAGLVAVAAFSERRNREREVLRGGHSSGGYKIGGPTRGGGTTRGGDGPATRGAVLCSASAGPTAGAAAGASVTSIVGTTTWERGPALGVAIVEYDTPEGWAARGVSFEPQAPLPTRNPWPGEIPAPTHFADPQTL